jgi:small conductance mechanosensitive channel
MDIQQFFSQLWVDYGQNATEIGRRFAVVILIIIAGKIAIRISRRLTDKTTLDKLKIDENLFSILRVIIHNAIIIVCIIMILDIFGVSTTSLIALLGAAGVAIAFALRDTLGNIAAGIMLLVLRPFCKEDFIESDNILGTVKEVHLFSTDIETADGVYISVPNSVLWGMPVKNFSRNPTRRMDVTVTVSYTTSVDAAFRALSEVIAQEPRFLKDPAPQVMVHALGESGMNITLRAWVASDVFWVIFWDQMKNVKEKIQEAGITIALPQRTVHIEKEPDAFKNLPAVPQTSNEVNQTSKDIQ